MYRPGDLFDDLTECCTYPMGYLMLIIKYLLTTENCCAIINLR